jgi:hypothetical protein
MRLSERGGEWERERERKRMGERGREGGRERERECEREIDDLCEKNVFQVLKTVNNQNLFSSFCVQMEIN